MGGILRRQTGGVKELARNPLAAMMAAQAFSGAKVHRGPVRKFAGLKSDAFDALDEQNRLHIEAALNHRAEALKCPVSDLGWAVSPQKDANGMHMVFVDRWEDIEKREWFRKKGQNE